MKAEYVNPFVESVYELFVSMLNANARKGEVTLSTNNVKPRQLTALIGFSGPVRGMVAMSFPVNTALAMVSRLLGTQVLVVDDTVSDAVGEFVNIVSGAAKAKFSGDGPPIDLSLPTVVRGSGYVVDYPSRARWLEVHFDSDLGPFSLQITFETQQTAKDGGAP